MADPGFWNSQEKAQATLSEVKSLRNWIDPYDKLAGRMDSALELDELLQDGSEPEMERDLDAEIARLQEEVESFQVRSLLRGPDDFRFAQLEISAGAGGTEAQDWAQMLMRMYIRWAERRGFEVSVLDESEGEEAGIKGAVLEIRGSYAYGFLRPETGVHRLVRISPFDANARRHTSFASVFVYPVVNRDQHRDSRRGSANRRVSRVRCGRPARQQDELRRAYHAPPDRDCRRLAGRAVAIQEQGDRHEDA
jgi:peptide chain release factor 2